MQLVRFQATKSGLLHKDSCNKKGLIITAKLSAIHIISAITAHNDWELEKTDVDSAYLNAPLLETIYM